MEVLSKTGQIIMLVALVYLWNRNVVAFILNTLVSFHRKHNAENLNRQPVKLLIDHHQGIYRFAKGFYWFSAVLIAFGIITS